MHIHHLTPDEIKFSLPHIDKIVNIVEPIKVVEILDKTNVVKYSLSMMPYIIDEDETSIYKFTIKIYNHWYEPVMEIISKNYTSYNEAHADFNVYVQTYASIVEVETNDCENINLYKDRINYKDACAKCCATCKFVKQNKFNFKCKNYKQFGSTDIHYHRQYENKYLPIEPTVNPLYICDGWEKK